jgi:hypothetical protein
LHNRTIIQPNPTQPNTTGAAPARETHSPASFRQRLAISKPAETFIVVDGSRDAALAHVAAAPSLAAGSLLAPRTEDLADGEIEGHVFGSVAANVHVAAGGSAEAALRAVYSLASAWGVWRGFDGDVVPSRLYKKLKGEMARLETNI